SPLAVAGDPPTAGGTRGREPCTARWCSRPSPERGTDHPPRPGPPGSPSVVRSCLGSSCTHDVAPMQPLALRENRRSFFVWGHPAEISIPSRKDPHGG